MDHKEKTIEFIEWILELKSPKYSMDVRRRYIVQIPALDGTFCWIDPFEFSKKQKFYTTSELYDIWLEEKNKKQNICGKD